MSTARVILDSDDEGSDFSPAKPIDALEELFSSAEDPNSPPHAINSFQTTGTTDSSFFRKIYDEHRVPTPADAPDHDGNLVQTKDPPEKSSAPFVTSPAREGRKENENWLNLDTSITDPIPASRKAKITSGINLSVNQVASPRKNMAGGQVDPWEIPSSPPVAMGKPEVAALSSSGRQLQSKSAKTYGSRKKTRRSSPPPELQAYDAHNTSKPETVNGKCGSPVDTEISSITTSKLRTGCTPRSAQRPQDDSFEDFAQGREHVVSSVAINADSSVTEDAIAREPVPVSLYVSTVALTARQKQEYQVIPPSSDPDQEGDYGLPAIAGPPEHIHKSSGATTIAYTTPSDFASSGRKAGSTIEPSSTRKRKLKSITEEIPPSSPDILSVTPDALKKQARDFYDEMPSSEADLVPRGSTRKKPTSRKKQAESEPQEESWGCEADGLHREEAAIDELHKVAALAANTSAMTAETWVFVEEPATLPSNREIVNDVENVAAVEESETPQPKKRGRKKKDPKSQDALKTATDHLGMASTVAPTRIVDDGELIEPAAKRKRGRPRKDDQPKTSKPEPGPEGPADTDYHETQLTEDVQPAVFQEKSPGNLADADEVPVDDKPLPQPKKRGRKRKQREEDTKEALVTVKEPAVLEDTSGNTSAVFDAASENATLTKVIEEAETATVENPPVAKTPKNEMKGPIKPASSTQPGKVLYRVGLSKRSRIAPLLKSLRK